MSEIVKQTQVKCQMCTSTEVVYDHLENVYTCKSCNSQFQLESDKVVSSKIEELIAKYPTSGELYFQNILARYGVTYVSESGVFTQKPTLCRASKVKIQDHKYYAKALQYASNERLKQIYIEKLDELEKLRNNIIIRASKQQDFDIFICYKRTAEGRTLTLDSAKARQIYEKLTKQGYKVFFAEETLVDFTGQEYEPVIYNALISSKVMLVIAGSEPEYVKAPWVKNEWSRFLSFIDGDGDKSRAIIPVCCNGFKVEDLPPRLSRRQILEYDGTFDEKLGKILKNFIHRGISSNITRGTTETKVEVKPIIVEEVSVEKRLFTRSETEIKITTRESTTIKSCKDWLEGSSTKKFDRVKRATKDVLAENPESSEAAWLYFLASIKRSNDEEALSFYFNKIKDTTLNDILSKVEVSLQHCNQRDYISRIEVIRSIVLNTLAVGDYVSACKIYSFIITLADDKFEIALATAVKDQLVKNIHNVEKKIKQVEVDTVMNTIYNTLTKLGAKGIIAVYNTVAEELLFNQYFQMAEVYFNKSLELFSADPDALWGKMLAQNKAQNDTEYAKKAKNIQEAIDNLITMQKGGYKLGTARRNYLMRLKEIGIQLLSTSKAKLAKDFYVQIYSLLPSDDKFTEIAYSLAVEFSELLLLKGFFVDAEEFYRLILAEHDQLDFTAHLGLLKCKAKCKSNFELLLNKKSYFDYFKNQYDAVREAEVECFGNGKLEREIFTEFDDFHEEIIENKNGRANLFKALSNAAKVAEKHLVRIDIFETLRIVKESKDEAVRGNAFVIADKVFKESERETKIKTQTTRKIKDTNYESKKFKSDIKLFNPRLCINLRKELLVIAIIAAAGLFISGMYNSNYMNDGFPLPIVIVIGIGVVIAGIISIGKICGSCGDDTGEACGKCLGWYFGIGIGAGLVAGVAILVSMGATYALEAIFGADMHDIMFYFHYVLAIPYLVFKAIDIKRKRRVLTIKYFVASIVILVLAIAFFQVVVEELGTIVLN